MTAPCPTPRTDQAAEVDNNEFTAWQDYEHVPADFARQLERELAAARAMPAGAAIDEGWLVENHEGGRIRYLSFDHSGMIEWVEDSLKALRCCRREDAEQLAHGGDLYDLRIAEHSWHSRPEPTTLSLRLTGIGRDGDFHRNLVLYFSDPPTTQDIHDIFETVRRAYP